MKEVPASSYDFLVGHGIDCHAIKSLSQDNDIWLGGVPISCAYQIIAHSDGDVILHALVDAMLGAIGQGDIGEHFPPTDPRWKDASSSQFVAHALQLCQMQQATVVNVDVTVISEVPKISPHKLKIRQKLSRLLNLNAKRINIKATTTEQLGFLGRREGIAADVIVSMKTPICA